MVASFKMKFYLQYSRGCERRPTRDGKFTGCARSLYEDDLVSVRINLMSELNKLAVVYLESGENGLHDTSTL